MSNDFFLNKYKKWCNRDVKGMNDSREGTPNEYRKLFYGSAPSVL
jgi:hypothetical protein